MSPLTEMHRRPVWCYGRVVDAMRRIERAIEHRSRVRCAVRPHLRWQRRLASEPTLVAFGPIERLGLVTLAATCAETVVDAGSSEELARVAASHPTIAAFFIAADDPGLELALCIAELWVRRARRIVVRTGDGDTRPSDGRYELTDDPAAEARAALAALRAQLSASEVFAAMHGLAARELEMVFRLARGTSRSDLAKALGVDRRTIATMVARVIAKTGFVTLEAAADALAHEMEATDERVR